MTEFDIPAGKNTPFIRLSSGTLTLKGKSFPENARKFYEELGEKLSPYAFGDDFYTELDFDYLSSSSVICILDLVKRLRKKHPSTRFHVKFFYDAGDEDMLGVGENYAKILVNHITLQSR